MSETGVVDKDRAVTLRDGQALDDAHRLVADGLAAVEAIGESAKRWQEALDQEHDEGGRAESAMPTPTFTDIGRLHAFADDVELLAESIATTIGELRHATKQLAYARGDHALQGAYYA